MRRQAQGLPMNLVIIAAILLIVLVVILFIFTGSTKKFTTGLVDCEAKGGKCKTTTACTGPTVGGTACEEKDMVCCIELG
ncbi:hypothetical protein ACFLZ7_03100 [Nanoarchaeota archaeon]